MFNACVGGAAAAAAAVIVVVVVFVFGLAHVVFCPRHHCMSQLYVRVA